MEIIAVLAILLLLVSVAVKSPKTYTPTVPRDYQTYTQIRSGHWERRITSYKLKRNIIYDLIKEPFKYGYSKGYTDQEMHQMGFKEYIIEPQYGQVWVPE